MADRSDDSVDRLIGQLEWMADELEAQRPFLARLSDAQLTAAPVAGEPSIRQRYEGLLRREREQHLPLVESMSSGAAGRKSGRPNSDEPETLDEIVSSLVELRRRLVDIVRTFDRHAWGQSIPGGSGTLETFLYEAALNDGDVLRGIGERLYESDLRLTDSGPDPDTNA